MALWESFFEPLVTGDQKTSLASLSPQLRLFRRLKGSLAWGPSLCLVHQAHKAPPPPTDSGGVLLCSSAHQSLKGAPWVALLCSATCLGFDGPASLLFSCQCWPVGWERLWGWLQPLRVTQHYRLASMAAWRSSTGISHHSLLPHIPWICLSAANRSPHPGIAPRSLNSSSQPLHILGEQHSCPGHLRLQQGLSNSHSI